MQISYDKRVDAVFIRLSSKHPEGAIEIDEGVILHVTRAHEIVAIEILDASKKFPVRNLFTLRVA